MPAPCPQIFGKNGLERMQCAVGDAFDPNLHNAMFELPDPSKEPGSVAHVVKVRFGVVHLEQ